MTTIPRRSPGPPPLPQPLFEEHAQPILHILAERFLFDVATPSIQSVRFRLMYAGLKPQQSKSPPARRPLQLVYDRLRQPTAAKVRMYEHPLDLRMVDIGRSARMRSSTTDVAPHRPTPHRYAVDPRDQQNKDRLIELLKIEDVPRLRRIAREQVRDEEFDQHRHAGCIRRFGFDND